MTEIIELTVESGIGILSMNHPPVNAINQVFAAELKKVLKQAVDDERIRVLLITSDIEGVFMAGADIKMIHAAFKSRDFSRLKETGLLRPVFNMIQFAPKPTIAVINGHAMGGGCELSLSCDYRIMARGTQIGLTEVHLGIIPALGGTQRIIRMVPPALAKRMLLEGLKLDAEKALEVGLVDFVFEREVLLDEAMIFAHRFANGPSKAYAALKRCINEGGDTDLISGIQLEKNLSDELTNHSEDAKEGMLAFIEKRKPVFLGK